MVVRGSALLSALLAVVLTGNAGGFQGLRWIWMLPAWFFGCYLGALLLFVLFTYLVTVFIDVSKPQEHDSKFHRWLANLLIDTLIPLCHVRVHTAGLEKTPTQGRFLLVCNHFDLPDPAVLLHCFPHSQLAFISKQENNRLPIVGKLMHKLMCQLINRGNDREALKTILKCVQLLKEDEVSIAVFPEGYATSDKKVHHFRSGVFKIAQKTGVPIVVCTLQNTQYIFRNILTLKPTDVEMHLAGVIQPEAYQGKTTIEIGEMVYEMMIADLGEEYRLAPEA